MKALGKFDQRLRGVKYRNLDSSAKRARQINSGSRGLSLPKGEPHFTPTYPLTCPRAGGGDGGDGGGGVVVVLAARLCPAVGGGLLPLTPTTQPKPSPPTPRQDPSHTAPGQAW